MESVMNLAIRKLLTCVVGGSFVFLALPLCIRAAEQKTPDGGAAAGREIEARVNVLQGKTSALDKQPAAEKKPLIFHGLNLSDAPVTNDFSKLPDLFEEQPTGSKSYHLRKDIKIMGIIEKENGFPTAQVFEIPGKNVFYFEYTSTGSSSLAHFYGPIQGDPMKVMNLENDKSIQIRQTTTPSSGAN
jgi:hypothetical protein